MAAEKEINIKKEIKILFTSVGRRVELMQAFKNAASHLGVSLKLYGADITEDAPALFYCDKACKVCKIREQEYIPQLLKICREEKIDLLIPTIDTDLLILSQRKAAFEQIGTKVFISDQDKIALCRDKRFTADFYIDCGVNSPKPVDNVENYQGGFPAFIKPKDGSSSIDAYRADTIEELKILSERVKDYIIQPFIDGREYTIDILCDFSGNPIYITPRERLAVRSGEVLKTRITRDDRMIEESLKVIQGFCPCGPITLQLIREKTTGIDYFIEINPRFGGGAPLSMMAGADAALAILQLILGEIVPYQEKAAQNGLIYSRFDQCICINQMKQQKEKSEKEQKKEWKKKQKQEIEQIQEQEQSRKIINSRKILSLERVNDYIEDIEAIILDLDDTLYNEEDYIRSGYKEIAQRYPELPKAQEELWMYFIEGKPAIDVFLKNHNLEQEKEQCLQCYRSHMPRIVLPEKNRDLLKKWHNMGKKLGIITDGRPFGQRNKIAALHLEELIDEIIVTDELAGNHGDVKKFRKPEKLAFQVMQMRLDIPYEKMIYIGDNQQKDFQAPEELHMKYLWFQNEKGLYQ